MHNFEKYEELHETVIQAKIKFILYYSYDSSPNFLKLNHVHSHYNREKVL